MTKRTLASDHAGEAAGDGSDDVAHRLWHADPENRALLCRSYRRHHLADRHADDGGESDG
ncbi:hypothetical protein [Natrinema sp. SYSU A 869]|uniref:hypothetical protein n=1 Tax=Natrinema sp. SYSU A 869 TaxID=2871694 RepID=UPI001CA3EDCF|nr:hypothetical protein [Natrinema sp. SYSU A 869]